MQKFVQLSFLSIIFFLSSTSKAADYYWVGGKGNWNDPTHWSFSSGGNGGAGIPNSNLDNVFFNENSFSNFSNSVFVTSDITIKNFNVNNTPNFKFHSNSNIQVNVSGSWNVISKFRNKIQGSFVFSGNGSQTIFSNSVFDSKVIFNGQGNYFLNSDFLVEDDIEFIAGGFNSNGKSIKGNSIIINTNNNVSVDLSNSYIVTDNFVEPSSHVSDFLTLNSKSQIISIGNPIERGVANCGSPVFTITTTVTTNYNGFGVSCNGASDGVVCVTVTGGVGPFSVTWLGGGPSGTYGDGFCECYTGVDAGTYSVIVTDLGQGSAPVFVSCGTSQSVLEPGEITLLTWISTDPSCNGVCDGSATPIIFGDVPPFTYDWSSGENTQTALQLCVGQNDLSVVDNNGCTFDTTFFILTPTPVLPNITTSNTSCFGVCDGVAVSTPTGGNGSPYTFAWSTGSNGPGPNQDSITALCAGPYSVTVTDNNGCTGTQNVNITEPLQILVSIVSQTNLICNGICSGAITTSTVNGTPGYTYQWFDATSGLPVFGQTNPNASGLCAGNYFVQVTDANGCQDVSPTVTLTQPPPITSTPTSTNILCFGQCNGVLSIVSAGGTGGHTYNWINAATSISVGTGNPLTGNCAGNYFAEITDGNGCIQNSIVVTITEPPLLTLSVNSVDILCNTQCTGTASASSVGGTGAVTIEWFTLPGNISLGVSASVNALCAGSYYAEVTDVNGCTDTVQFTITEPDALTVVTETGSNVLCNGACDGTTTFDVTGGTPNYSVEWFNATTGLTINQFGNSAVGLCPGDYFAIATDANNCTLQSINLTVAEPPVLTISINSNNISCNGACDGSATVAVGGGTPNYTVTWFDQFNVAIGQTGSSASGLCPGTYHADVVDANGCTISSNNVIITEPLPLTGTVATTDATCNGDCDGTAIVTPIGGQGPFTYSWTSSPNTIETELNLCAGNYDVTITDANGCAFGPINFNINENSNFTFDFAIDNPTCFGDCDGTATVSNIAGEGGIYNITWSSSANTGLVENGLCVSNYTLFISDQNGCDTTHDFSITTPTLLVLTPNFADPSCSGICDGTASANPTGGTTPYSFAWVNLANGPMATTTDTISNLCPGNYEVTVTDANGCSQVTGFTITDPGGLSATTTPTPASCGLVCDGQEDVTIVGGTGPFTVEWFDATSGISTNIFGSPGTNMCAGNYYAVITDANGCSVLSDTTTITQTVVIDGALVVTDPTCFGACDGSINLTPNGGILPYTFQWFDQATLNPIGQNTEDAINLCEGDYFVIITDANGCSSAPLIENINDPAQLTVTVLGTDATCFGVCNGSITSTPTGGSTPYSFQWINASTGTPIGQISQNASGLCAGDYELVVTDANGCTITSSVVTITEPTQLIGNLTFSDANCFGVCDGSSNFSVSGGNIPYTFSWSSSGNTTDTENGLCAGNYTVSMTDGNGCTLGPNNFTIDEPAELTVVTTGSAVLCNGDCNGSALATPSGGTTPFTYLWNDPSAQTTQIASGLCAGNYNVVVTDANGCSSSPTSVTVTEPTIITINSITSTDATCGGICDGTAAVTANGGTGAFTFLWDDPLTQTTQTAISLCAGNYNVIVTDANGCSTVPNPITVSEPNTLTVSVNITDESCFNACDGIATAIIAGGTGLTTFQWDDPTLQTSNPATGLCGGTYTVDVTDANGCSTSASGIVNSANDISATISSTDAQCSVCDGTATVNASGGTGTLNLQWDAAAGNQVTATATSLCAGVYQVTISDANGCSQVFSAPVSNPNGETLTMSSVDASCEGNCDGTGTVTFVCSTPGCTILWNDPAAQTGITATGLCEGSYGVTVTNGAGCISAGVINIIEPSAISVNISSTDAVCNGDCNGTASSVPSGGDGNYTFIWDDPSTQTDPAALNLCPGTYSVIVTDGNGCVATASTIVSDPTVLSATVSSTDATCNTSCDGTGTVFPVGGVAPYSFVWDDPAGQATQMATGLCAGTYNVTVIDAGGCTFGPLNITVSEPDALVGNISATNLNCNGDCDGTATLNLVGGTTPYTFLWDDPSSQTNQTAINLCAGSYNVVATDVNGCATTPFGITLAEPTALTISMTSTDVDCFGNCNGTASATVNGGTLPYTSLWNDPSAQTTLNAFNLCGGNFTIEVTDGNGCTISSPVTIAAPTNLLANSVSSDVSCFDLCNGVASVNPSGGTLPYTFLWSDGSSANNISSLCPGNYDVDISDANGCNTTQSFTIVEPSEITATSSIINSTCNVCNGSAFVSPTGGTGPYSYQWDAAAGSAVTQTVNNLCAGIYSVTITDATGCSITVGVSITDNNAETVTLTFTDASCFGVCDGTVLANTTCVDAPCTFEWFDGTGTSLGIFVDNASGLCADNYFVEVTNATGCISIVSDTIFEPEEIEGNGISTDAACALVCDGEVALNPTGGNGVFTFQWNDPATQTTQTATGLCGSTVDVDITSGGCTITESYFIDQPSNLSASVSVIDAQCNLTCNGSATVTITGGDSPFTFLWNDGAAQTTQTAINLCAGNYDVTITDVNGCTIVESVIVAEPPALSATFSSTDVDCFGNCNGSATVNPSGGVVPYTVVWDDPALQNSLTATGLCAGNYSVVVSDATGCSTLPFATTVNENNILQLTASSTEVTCNTFCDGTVTGVGSGGDGNYQFSIDGGANFQASGLFSNLCAGAYTVTIIDGSGCSGTATVNVNEPSSLGGSVTSFNATCAVANGSANAIPTGGTPSYSYVWMDNLLNPIGQTTQGATGLSAGTYNVQITDANGCIIILSAIINNFNAPTISVNATTQPTCNGDCNGAIDMNVVDGTPNYTYLWIPDGQTTEDITNVCAGNYLLQVTDAAGCIAFNNVSLIDPTAITANLTLVDATCNACDGTAVANASGGDGNFTFNWTNGQSGTNASALCAGSYGVQITDGLGCDATVNFSINNPTGPTGENIVSTNASCFGICDGTATVTPIGGTAPYTFFWVHDGTTVDNVSNLCAGTYFCEVTDANGCIRVTNVTITGGTQMQDSTVISPATCGVCDGSLSIFMSAGNGPFTFQWDAAAGNSVNQNVTNLCEGIYSVVATDGIGCTQQFTYAVNGDNAPQLSMVTTDANCNGSCDGTATLTISGGAGPFVDEWLDNSGTSIGVFGTSNNALCSGDYFVEITDQATGCIATIPFTIDQPENLQFSLPFIQDNSCFNSCDGIATAIVIEGTLPYTYVWTDPATQTTASATSLCVGTFDVTVTDANGCTGTQSATITEPTQITMAFVPTDASCSTVADGAIDVTAAGGTSPYTYSWTGPNNFTSATEDLTNILMGMYYLTTTDANGCSQTDSAFVNALIIVIADAGNDTTVCGSLPNFTVNGNGGVTYEWYDTTGVLLASTQSYSFVPPSNGTLTLILFAYDGLCTDSDTIDITINPIPNADAGPDVMSISGIPVIIGGSPTGPSGSTYAWSPNSLINDSTLSNPTITPDTTGFYVVTVIDVNGCVASDTMIVNILPPIFIPNGFSPNGDGNNDVWEIDDIEFFPDCQVEVYNRWGQLLFLSNGYQVPWDGNYKNQTVPIGTYYYIINLNHPLFPDAYTGPLTILR